MKQSQRYAPFLIAVLVLLAGCGAGIGTTESEPEPTLNSTAYPSGMSQAGYENDTQALMTFREAMASGPAYTVNMDVQAETTTQTLVARTDPESEELSATIERNGTTRFELYYANGTQSLKNSQREPAKYNSANATFENAVVGFNGGQFLSSVRLLDLNATDVSREDGRTVLTYDIVGPRSSAKSVDSASGTLRVTTEGQLVDFEYTVVLPQNQKFHVTWEQTKVGSTTVEPPEWLSKARGG